MKRFTLLLILFTAFFVVGCSNVQIQTEVAEQNKVNADQAAADLTELSDLLDKAAKGDESWKESWDKPDETDPDLKGAIRSSYMANAAGFQKTAKEIVEIAKLSK